jgi:hypothetical protein
MSNHVPLINTTMQFSWSCLLLPWSKRRFAYRFGPAGVFLPHDICRSRPRPEPTYINPHSDLQNLNRSTLPESIVLHLPASFDYGRFTGWVHATLTISTLPVRSVFSSKRIAEVSGLPEYVASTASHNHIRPYNDRSLIDTGGITTSSLKLDASQDSTRSQVKIMIILILQGFTMSIKLYLLI